MRLTTRFYSSFFVIIALFVLATIYSNIMINRVNASHQHMTSFVVERSADVNEFEAAFNQFNHFVQFFIIYYQLEVDMSHYILEYTQEAVSGLVSRMQEISISYIETVNADTYITEQNRLLGVGKMSAMQMNIQQIYRILAHSFFSNNYSQIDLFALDSRMKLIENNINNLRPHLYAEIEHLDMEISEALLVHTFNTTIIIILIVLLSSFLAWHTTSAFSLRIKFIEHSVLMIKQGDLSLLTDGDNEITRLINDAISTMREVINRITQVMPENKGDNIDTRINIEGFEGAYKEVLLKVNSLIDAMDSYHYASMRTAIAEESTLAKSRFLARMSHEIRTPITAVMGVSEIQLHDKNLSASVVEAFAKIFDSSKILLRIINDILDISKIEAGKMDLIIDRYETYSLITDTTQLYLASFVSEKVKFILDIDENIPMCLIGDDLRIKQIVTNVLSNAFKYTDKGSVRLTMHCESAEEDNVLLNISVEDTGRGMSESQIMMITDEYSRFHEQEYRFTPGTGLGMSIMKNLVKMMKGFFEIQSTIDIGTAVRITIPQKAAGKEVLGKKAVKKLENYEAGSLTKKITKETKYRSMSHASVLVVDDVNANLYVAKELMGFYDLNIETESSGQAALDKIREGNTYDIIFLDHMMPNMKGDEVVRRMRKMGYDGCVIAFTANAMIGQAEKFLQNGFDGVLSKPIQTVQLATVLEKFIPAKPEIAYSTPKLNKYLPDINMLETMEEKFFSGQKDFVKNLKHELENDNYDNAAIMVHTVKSVTLMLGMDDVSAWAGELENLFGENKTSEELLQKLYANMDALMLDLEKKYK
ncbi:MAG: ATP-binding protein [Defluviitaleaceae bacterium]|nr:ATP-binding protein [Defluviitaleaceae bacterium]